MNWEPCHPHKGDMIRTKVDFYYHYGIYVDDESVIQFGPPDGASREPDEIEVISTNIDIFRNGGEVETAKLDLSERLKRNSADKTVEIARSRIGEKGYNILHNNCEHFANECVFGAPHSGVVDSIRRSIREKLSRQSDKSEQADRT